jgi:hypothetical protein
MAVNSHPEPGKGVTSRREFMRGGMRHLLFGGLALAGAWLVARTGRRTCETQGMCSTCPDYTTCLLPNATANKQSLDVVPPSAAVRTNSGGLP